MKKNKRALAFGLAAAQLAALTSAVAPLTAFADAALTVSSVQKAINEPSTITDTDTLASYKKNMVKIERVSKRVSSGTTIITVTADVADMKSYYMNGKSAKWIAIAVKFDRDVSAIKDTEGLLRPEDITDAHYFVKDAGDDADKYLVFWLAAKSGGAEYETTLYFDGDDEEDMLPLRLVVNSTSSTEANETTAENSRVSAAISGTREGGTVSIQSTGVSAANVAAAAKKNITLDVLIDDTYNWIIETAKLSKADALDLTVASASVPFAPVAAIEGSPATDAIGFTTKAANLGSGASLKITTNSKSTASTTNYANLYKLGTDGTLTFITAAPVDADGRTLLPVTENGSFVTVISDETKLMCDLDNDCRVTSADVLAGLRMIAQNGPMTRAEQYKLDYNGDGSSNSADIIAILKDLAAGKIS